MVTDLARVLQRCAVGLALLGGLGGQPRATFAQTADKAHQKEGIYRYLIRGWKSEREKLLCGSVRMDGTWTSRDKKTPIRFATTFDNLKRYYRGRYDVDGRDPLFWQRNPEFVATCVADKAPVVELHKLTEKLPADYRYVDPRCFGAGTYADFNSGCDFEQMVHFWEDEWYEKGLRLTKNEAGLFHFEGTRVKNDTKMVIRIGINENKGFSFEYAEFSTLHKAPDGSEISVLASRTDCSWAEAGGIWHPIKLICAGQNNNVELKLDWANVGKPFPDDEFSLNNLGPPDGTNIYDLRLASDQPVRIGEIRRTRPTETLPPLSSNAGPLRGSTKVLIGVNFVLLTALLAMLYWWRRRTRTKSVG